MTANPDNVRPTEIPALPKVSTLALTVRQRALGRLAKVKTIREPENDSERDLAGDTFWNIYQSEPKDRDTVPAERMTNKALLDWMKETHGFEEARAHAVGNLAASMMAAGLMWSHLTNEETMQEALKKQQQAEEQASEARAKQAAADAMMNAATQMEKDGNADANQMRSGAQQAMNDAAAAQRRAEKLAAEAQEMIEAEHDKPLAQAKMARAMKDAAEKAKDVAESAAGWGMGSGSMVNTDPNAALAFLKENQGKIAQIARLAGRMRGFALQARRERSPRGIIPNKVALTQDIRHIFTTELAMLRPDAPATMRAQKIAQFVDVGLLGYKPTADAEKDGPFVAAIDCSGSMGGSRELVAKAVSLGVAQVAKMDGRPYILFSFSSNKKDILVVHSDDGWDKHLEWAKKMQSGGTNFDMAIDKAMELLQGLRRADCLFISDGEAGIQEETAKKWRSFQQDTGSRLFYVPVGRGGYIDIEDLSDKVYELAELDEATGADLAGQIGRWMW